MSIPRASMSESYLSKCTTCQSLNVGLVQKSRTGNFHDILTFSGIGGIVNILLNTQGEREKTKEKQNNITCLKTNSCLPLTVLSTPPPARRKCDLPEGAHSAALAEKVH